MDFDVFEFRRQSFHALFGVALAALIYYEVLSALLLLILFFISLSLSFFSLYWKVPVLSWFLEVFEREETLLPGRGVVFYFLGAFVVVLLFQKNIALASLLILSFGDSVSHYVGRFHGSLENPLNRKKMVEGFGAGWLAGLLTSWAFIGFFPALVASFFAMVVESLELKTGPLLFDDNLTVPLVSALTAFLAMLL